MMMMIFDLISNLFSYIAKIFPYLYYYNQSSDVNKNAIPSNDDEGLVTILSIDGGGIRGVIPCYILAELETILQRLDGKNVRIVDYFDHIAGTNTGAIATMAMLTTPSTDDGRPCSAKEIINHVYRGRRPKKIDEENKRHEWVRRWLGPGVDELKSIVQEKLRKIPLANTLTNVVIPTYDINILHPTVFSTRQAKNMKSQIKFEDVINKSTTSHEANNDNHPIAANNPTIFALHEATKDLVEKNPEMDPPNYSKFLVLSLGTGSAKLHGYKIVAGTPFEWNRDQDEGKIPPLIDILFRASNDLVEMCTALLLGHNNSHHNFLRIQDYKLDPDSDKFDDESEKNINQLERIVKKLLGSPAMTSDKITGLQTVISPKDPKIEKSLLVNGKAPTYRQRLEEFAQRLSAEKKRRSARTVTKSDK